MLKMKYLTISDHLEIWHECATWDPSEIQRSYSQNKTFRKYYGGLQVIRDLRPL